MNRDREVFDLARSVCDDLEVDQQLFDISVRGVPLHGLLPKDHHFDLHTLGMLFVLDMGGDHASGLPVSCVCVEGLLQLSMHY